MESKLYVGNLSYTTSEDDLRDLFSQSGNVKSVALIKDRETSRSKGFAFVEMGSNDEAQKAIDQFHGQQFQTRTLTVNIARPREERPRGSFGGGGGMGGGRDGGGYRGGGGGGGRDGGHRGGGRDGGRPGRDW